MISDVYYMSSNGHQVMAEVNTSDFVSLITNDVGTGKSIIKIQLGDMTKTHQVRVLFATTTLHDSRAI